MNELSAFLKDRIRADGALSLHDYMHYALNHPDYGYYQHSEPFGSAGDFVTAPEISQMFGELIGLWCVDAWEKLGKPTTINLVEIGPGRGTLMSDALRSARLAPEFMAAVNVNLVETSERLTAIQKQQLGKYSVTWHRQFPKLDESPLLVLANEFFDALPIHQFESKDGQWFEREIALTNEYFSFSLSNTAVDLKKYDLPNPAHIVDGKIKEINLLSQQIVRQIATHLKNTGGAALIIDYGPMEDAIGDSFQAIKDHKYADPLENPGSADLTAHVDFSALSRKSTQNGCVSLPITSQGRFLERLGIEARAMVLSAQATEAQKEKISQDLRRLISAEEMGTLFKVLSFYHNMSVSPAGFGE